MSKKENAVKDFEKRSEQVVSETTQETVETPVEGTDTEESVEKYDTESGSNSVEETENVNEKESEENTYSAETNLEETDTETVEEKPEDKVFINDGAEGDAGQTSLNDIPVDFEDISELQKNDDINQIYVDTDIKLQNILNDLETIEENDISFTKNEDLPVAIEYVKQAIRTIGKLRK